MPGKQMGQGSFSILALDLVPKIICSVSLLVGETVLGEVIKMARVHFPHLCAQSASFLTVESASISPGKQCLHHIHLAKS